jgi:transcriptional regulator with XRE-family HTH domain
MKLRIKEVCTLKGITQKELAEKIGTTEVTLSRATNGNTSLDMVEKIANALGVEVAELFAPSQSNRVVCPKCGAVLELVVKE